MIQHDFEFPVTNKHISAGKRNCSRVCAVALALRDYFGGNACEVSVGDSDAIITTSDGDEVLLSLEDRAIHFIEDFDSDRFVRPTTLVASIEEG